MRSETPVNTIIIFIVIIGILLFAGMALPGIIGKSDSARFKATEAQLNRLSGSIESYKSDMGRLPPTLDKLLNNLDQISEWNGPYIESSLLKDAWGNHYIYVSNGTTFKIESYGADKEPGGEGYNADLAIRTDTSG